MVRLLVRKSLLSSWTSSRLYGRRRVGPGRTTQRRTVTAAAAAGDEEGHDIRLDVLFFSCCCSSDDSACCCCCCCCVTDEECQDTLDVGGVRRRRCGCKRRSVVRCCSTKVFVVASLFVFFTLTTLYSSPSSATAFRDDSDPLELSSVVLLSSRQASDASVRSLTPALLANPDCDAIIAGDQAEIASTQRMLFLETRRTSTTLDADRSSSVNCTSTLQSSPVNVDRSPLAYIISNVDRDVEQAELLLRAVYAAANVYCLTFDFCSTSDHVAAALRRLVNCFDNIITVERGASCGSRSRDRKWTAWWRCVNRLLRHHVDWTHIISLTGDDFPLRPPDDIARRLTTNNFDFRWRRGNDVIECGAYARSAVSQRSMQRRSGNSSSLLTNSSALTNSPEGASAIEVCARKCAIVDDKNDDARCYYTVADLRLLVRQRKLFAHAFNLNVDHYAIRCLMPIIGLNQ